MEDQLLELPKICVSSLEPSWLQPTATEAEVTERKLKKEGRDSSSATAGDGEGASGLDGAGALDKESATWLLLPDKNLMSVVNSENSMSLLVLLREKGSEVLDMAKVRGL